MSTSSNNIPRHHHHHNQQQQQQEQQQQEHRNDGGSGDSSSSNSNPQEQGNEGGEGGDLFGNSSLDHALLESLFYSEMMHLNGDDTNVLSQQLLSTLTADGTLVEPPPGRGPHTTSADDDPNVAAEQDLLNHFGVNHDNNDDDGDIRSRREQEHHHHHHHHRNTTASPEPQVSSSLTASLAPELMLTLPPRLPSPASDVVLNAMHAGTDTDNATTTTTITTAPHNPLPLRGTQRSLVDPSPAHVPVPSEEEKRTKLVNQFALLASRLGITLPNNVLQSLSQVADSTTTAATTTGTTTTTTSAAAAATSTHARVPSPSPETPRQVQQLAAAAEAAIASVGLKKRSRSESPPQQTTTTTATALSTAAAVAAAKRRKKPRLVECEHKLAELKAENAMLKGHLANLSAQSHQLDQERQAQEQRMRQMLTSGSTEDELNQAIQTFQDMYSDYGRRRHSELTFHLDQLLRLANPTNFTKMGLWTMGQQSKNNRNPIASILQKELEITPQQGKKIVEQREKIRRVCDNMKEVRIQAGEKMLSLITTRQIPFLTHYYYYHYQLLIGFIVPSFDYRLMIGMATDSSFTIPTQGPLRAKNQNLS